MKKKAMFTRSIRVIIWLLVMISVIGFLLGNWLLRFYAKMEQENIEETIHRFIELNDNQYRQLNQELLYIAANDSSVKALAEMAGVDNPDYRQLLNYNINLSQVQSRLRNVVSVYGSEYYVWLYETRTETFVDWGDIGYEEKMEYRESLEMQLKEKSATLSQNGKWFVTDGRYLCTSLRFANVYIGMRMEASEYLNNIMQMKLASSYSIGILDGSGQTVCARKFDHGVITDIDFKEDNLRYQMKIQEQGEKSNFSIVFRLQQKWYENAYLLQMAVIFVSLIILGAIVIFSLYLRGKVLHPILNFYHQIVSCTDLTEIRAGEVAELDSVARMINNLLDEVQKLEIDNYEQKMRRQEAELGFAQQQIRPHFFINCLNVIYSMAQINQKEDIQELCVDISDYMRILFAGNSDLVPVLRELEMIEKYLSIVSRVYGQELDYTVQKRCRLDGVLTPPLLIQTFVENSVKYGDQEEGMQISVTIDRREEHGSEYLMVEVQDSGVGFSDEVLEKLKKGIAPHRKAGYQIGIANVIQRLKLLYGEDWKLMFCNNEQGAKVTVWIPDRRKYEKKD